MRRGEGELARERTQRTHVYHSPTDLGEQARGAWAMDREGAAPWRPAMVTASSSPRRVERWTRRRGEEHHRRRGVHASTARVEVVAVAAAGAAEAAAAAGRVGREWVGVW